MKKAVCVLMVAMIMSMSMGLLCLSMDGEIAADVVYISDIEYESYFVLEGGEPHFNRTEYGELISIADTPYEKGLTMHPTPSEDAYIEYDISEYSSKYRYFTCIIGKDDCTKPAPEAQIEGYVLLDEVDVGYSEHLACGDSYIFTIDISGGKMLKLITTNGGDGHGWDTTSWADAKLCNLEVKEMSFEKSPKKVDYNLSEALDVKDAMLLVKLSNDETIEVPVKTDMVTGFDSSKGGKQTLTVTYNNKTLNYDITVIEQVPTASPAPTEALTATPKPTKIPAITTEVPKTDNGQSSNGAVIAIIIAAVVVVAAIVIIIIKKRSK